MGKPRMIILIRHAQSEGNKNRQIHQYIPDHRVKLTADGWKQAEDAGRRLRALLKPDDSIQIFTSPYRRTRETTQGILSTLTSSDPGDPDGPSPFQRENIKVWEEPRLREQDFGNFQPCSAEMERIWQERADYGHFFYRIPNGESAADAYDRVSGFNESLWRQFSDDDFPSVCVLVTHGLMTRVFLMKWYHWSVEYFEDLRNINHCEFIMMKRSKQNGKYILQNTLRTWSELKRRVAALQGDSEEENKNANRTTRDSTGSVDTADIPTRRWGGCANGCNHAQLHYPSRIRRQNTMEYLQHPVKRDMSTVRELQQESDDHPIASKEDEKHGAADKDGSRRKGKDTGSIRNDRAPSPDTFSDAEEEYRQHTYDPQHQHGKAQGVARRSGGGDLKPSNHVQFTGRDFGGSHSGVGSPADVRSPESSASSDNGEGESNEPSTSTPRTQPATKSAKSSYTMRTLSQQELEEMSGMNGEARADALGDTGDEDYDEGLLLDVQNAHRPAASQQTDGMTEEEVEQAKDADRKSFSEVY